MTPKTTSEAARIRTQDRLDIDNLQAQVVELAKLLQLPPGIEDLAGLSEQQLDAMLARKMLAAHQKVERIEKDATNPHHGYQYASEQAIKEALHPILGEVGLLFGLECDHTKPPVRYELGDGKAQLLLPLYYVFTDADTGHSKRVEWWGTGHLRDDKGLYGALTGALKYALTTSLLIPTGDDPEADSQPVTGRQPIRGPQQPAQPPGGTRPAQDKPAPQVVVPDDAGLRCISCGHVVAAGKVRQTIANFDGRNGQVMKGEKGYACPGVVASLDGSGKDETCSLFQSVHGAGVNHRKTLQEESQARANAREGTTPDPALDKHLAEQTDRQASLDADAQQVLSEQQEEAETRPDGQEPMPWEN